MWFQLSGSCVVVGELRIHRKEVSSSHRSFLRLRGPPFSLKSSVWENSGGGGSMTETLFHCSIEAKASVGEARG